MTSQIFCVGEAEKIIFVFEIMYVIFIEENNHFIFGTEFAKFVKESGNYFVLISRSPLKTLPYSIHEIYEIVTEGKRTDIND